MPLPEIARWTITVLLTAALATAAVNDVRERKIPNWTVLAILVLALPWLALHPLAWDAWAMLAGAIAFAVTFGLYNLGVFGAGDSKLFTVVALFPGLGHLAILALAVAVVGGLIAVLSLIARPTRALVMFNLKGRGDFGQGVPYGVAIAAGGALVTWGALLAPPGSAFA
jgi:prepilin peptidase CpaA